MKQSVVTPETAGIIIAKAQGIIDRPMTDMEIAFVEYAVDQIRLGLVGVA
jgi:Holliday junction resolvasome RuvABC endonuclease subunit